MRSSSSTARSAAVAAALFSGAAHAFWRMDCHSRIGLARMDPLVDPGVISDHAHAIHGGSSKSICFSIPRQRSPNPFHPPPFVGQDVGNRCDIHLLFRFVPVISISLSRRSSPNAKHSMLPFLRRLGFQLSAYRTDTNALRHRLWIDHNHC